MKRILCLIFVVSQVALFGQMNYYQLRNSGFESWDTLTIGNITGVEPTNWNSHLDNQGSWASTARSNAQLFQSTDAHSGSFSCEIRPRGIKIIVTIWANGLVTTGRVNAGSTSASNSANHNVTLRGSGNDDYNAPFYGKPDSIVFWAKFVSNNTTREARMNAFIHGDYDCTDPLTGNSNSSSYIVGQAEKDFARGNQLWNRHAVAFDYNKPHSNAQYMLVTFATNKTAGGTADANDRLFIDDIEMIYNIHLNDLKIAGATPSNFHKDTLTYNYYLCPGDAIPVVSYTGSSPRADILKDSTGSTTTIEVGNTGNPNVSRTYTVNFIYQTIQAPTASNVSICGTEEVTLSATVGTNGTTCRWYSDTTSTPISTGTSCSLGQCTKDTVLFASSYNETTGCESYRIPVSVTMNTVPGTPVVINDTICGSGTVNLSASVGTDGSVCRWYASDTSTTALSENNSFNISTDKDTSFWVSSYNTTTECESEKVQVKVVVNPIPQAPVVNNGSRCGSGSVTLNVESPQTGMEYIWYASDDTPLDTANAYTQTFTKDSTVKVSTYNPQTGCESGKTSVNITINPIPGVPSIATTDYCNEEEIIITPAIGNNGNNINWYDAASGGSLLKVFINDTLRNITAGTHTFYISSVNTTTSCESAREEITINIYPAYNTILNDTTVCGSYTWNGTTYNESGDYSQTFQSVHGCDSIISQTVNVNLPVTTHLKDTTCEGSPYQKYGFDLIATSDNVYRDTLTAVNTCDSIIELELKVYPNYTPDTIRSSICGTGAYHLFFGRHLTEAGIYDTIIKTVHGCDSLVVIKLSIGSAFEETINITKCYGESYSFKGDDLTEAGTYRDTLQATNGCDSIVILHLTIRDEISIELNVEECSSYTWNDSTYIESTSHSVTFSSVNGCDSIVTLNLTINYPALYQFNDTACVSYIWNDIPYMLSGDYNDTLVAANGCDSIVTLHLIINESVIHEIYDTACSSYEWKNNTYMASAILTDTVFGGANNTCDSITVLHLTINQPAVYEFNHSACGSYLWKGDTRTLSGDYNDTLVAANGCDSIVTLHLTINQPAVHEFNHSACGSYLWKGKTHTTPGSYSDTLIGGANNGCDSITVLHLTIKEPVTHEIYDTACMSRLWKGNLYTESSILNDTLTAGNGCDSIIVLHLTINYPKDTITIYDAICQGYAYTENGFDLPVQITAGTKEHERMIDCDTLVILHLTVNRNYSTGEMTRIACDSYTWNDSVYYESGNYVQTFKTIHGCDSTVTLRLTINPSSDSVYIFDEICQGDVYTENGFNLSAQETAGVFVHAINPKNSTGCDSVIHLTLTVHPAGKFHIQDTIKVGETYNKHGFDITPKVSGIYRDTLYLTSSYDCDSTVILLLIAQKETNINECGNMEQSVYLFPNPAQNQVTISASISIKQMEIYNIDGKLLDVVHSKDSLEIVYDINRYPKGLYFVKIQTENGIITKKLIIQ